MNTENYFLIGVNSAFDLLGVQRISTKCLEEKKAKRLRKNSVSHDFETVGNDLKKICWWKK